VDPFLLADHQFRKRETLRMGRSAVVQSAPLELDSSLRGFHQTTDHFRGARFPEPPRFRMRYFKAIVTAGDATSPIVRTTGTASPAGAAWGVFTFI
jgi:hypothetical protein